MPKTADHGSSNGAANDHAAVDWHRPRIAAAVSPPASAAPAGAPGRSVVRPLPAPSRRPVRHAPGDRRPRRPGRLRSALGHRHPLGRDAAAQGAGSGSAGSPGDRSAVRRRSGHHLRLGSTPAWAASSFSGVDLYGPGTSSHPADIATFELRDRRRRQFKGRITSYQVWNEANLSSFYRGTPAQMADLTLRLRTIVKANDPAAKVVAASTGTRLLSAYRAFYPRYLPN